MTFWEATILAHAASTWFMVGLIWFVQIVHYPGFARVSGEAFVGYSRQHVRRTGWVVGPPMFLEAASAVALVALRPSSTLVWVGLALLVAVWVSTALLQVPAHSRLQERFNEGVIRRLVNSNWIRTVAWSARGVVALGLLLM